MAEEQRLQELGGHRLCANNCGFFGSPTTLNLCSKCYKDHCLREQQMSKAMVVVEKGLSATQSESSSSSSSVLVSSDRAADGFVSTLAPPAAVAMKPNRCATCRKRVGLTGFKCRCGTTFCSSHRYPEQHGCTFDFKSMGREEIAKANPIVKADKLDRI